MIHGYFDNFTEALENSPCINKRLSIMGFTGNALEWKYNRSFSSKKNQIVIDAGFSDRPDVSSRMVKAEVIVFDKNTKTLTYNSVYRDTKGLFFNKSGDKYYILKEGIPDSMK